MKGLAVKRASILSVIFVDPVRTNIKWRDVEALLLAEGATKSEGRGSRVRFLLNGEKLDIHRPHPKPELKRYQVRAVREFLSNAGVEPK